MDAWASAPLPSAPPPPYGRGLAELYDEAFAFAERAKARRQQGDLPAARTYLAEALRAFLAVLEAEPDARKRALVGEHVQSYIVELRALDEQMRAAAAPAAAPAAARRAHEVAAGEGSSEELARRVENAKFISDQALSAERKGQWERAIALYTAAGRAFIEALESLPADARPADLKQRADDVLSRRRLLQEVARSGSAPATPPSRAGSEARRPRSSPRPAAPRPAAAAAAGAITPPPAPSNGARRPARRAHGLGGRTSKLTEEEKRVLRASSVIAGKVFLPFLEDVDDKGERFDYPLSAPFVDSDGLLPLAPQQQRAFGGWERARNLFRNPRMIEVISPFSIKQTIISDCSFVSALAVCANYERVFGKKLVTRCIYPQDSHGNPVFNPGGKYMLRLKHNGVTRKVIVDDFLPVDRSGQLLCSFSNNPSELWVSILEKGFLKLMGGYNFPGSNGGIDLHILTGWIPDRVPLQGDQATREAVEDMWQRIVRGLRGGECVVTTSTREMSEAEADALGLVPTHAYAVLRVEELEGVRLLQLKNPWARKRWTGRFSPEDAASWTPRLRAALRYDQELALQVDNGVFWIDLASLQRHFASLYVNWNPERFRMRRWTLHDAWPVRRGPRSDAYNREYSPQYRLEVQGESEVWVLLTKHTTQKLEREEDFITLHVYRGGARVYYPDDPEHSGVYINNPHYLVRLYAAPPTPAAAAAAAAGDGAVAGGARAATAFTLVVSQFEKVVDLSYSIDVFSNAPFSLTRLPRIYDNDFARRFDGQWTAETAAGSTNNAATYFANPQIQVRLTAPTRLELKLEAPKEFSVNVMVLRLAYSSGETGGRASSWGGGDPVVTRVADSGNYRPGFCYVEVPAETLSRFPMPLCLTCIVSTYHPDERGRFVFRVGSTEAPVEVTAL